MCLFIMIYDNIYKNNIFNFVISLLFVTECGIKLYFSFKSLFYIYIYENVKFLKTKFFDRYVLIFSLFRINTNNFNKKTSCVNILHIK